MMKTYRMIISACTVATLLLTGCRKKMELIGTVGRPVDLGLTVMWADHNLGGESATDGGLQLTITTKGKKKVVDTAKYMWGGGWHSPTIAQMRELIDECDWRYTTQNGVDGFLVTGRNGNTIFLPRYFNANEKAFGMHSIGNTKYQPRSNDEGLDYWTSEIDKDNAPYVGFMYMNNKYVDMSFSLNNWRKCIRPVMRNKHYRRIEEKDRVRDTVLFMEQSRSVEARKALETKLASGNVSGNSGKLFTKVWQGGKRLTPLQLDTAKVINFTLAELDSLDNVFYRCNDLDNGYVCFTDEQDVVTMRFKGLLAFAIDLVTSDDKASVSLNYSYGNRYRSKFVDVKKGVSTYDQVFYSDKDSVTTINLSAWRGEHVTLKRIRLFHSLALTEDK